MPRDDFRNLNEYLSTPDGKRISLKDFRIRLYFLSFSISPPPELKQTIEKFLSQRHKKTEFTKFLKLAVEFCSKDLFIRTSIRFSPSYLSDLFLAYAEKYQTISPLEIKNFARLCHTLSDKGYLEKSDISRSSLRKNFNSQNLQIVDFDSYKLYRTVIEKNRYLAQIKSAQDFVGFVRNNKNFPQEFYSVLTRVFLENDLSDNRTINLKQAFVEAESGLQNDAEEINEKILPYIAEGSLQFSFLRKLPELDDPSRHYSNLEKILNSDRSNFKNNLQKIESQFHFCFLLLDKNFTFQAFEKINSLLDEYKKGIPSDDAEGAMDFFQKKRLSLARYYLDNCQEVLLPELLKIFTDLLKNSENESLQKDCGYLFKYYLRHYDVNLAKEHVLEACHSLPPFDPVLLKTVIKRCSGLYNDLPVEEIFDFLSGIAKTGNKDFIISSLFWLSLNKFRDQQQQLVDFVVTTVSAFKDDAQSQIDILNKLHGKYLINDRRREGETFLREISDAIPDQHPELERYFTENAYSNLLPDSETDPDAISTSFVLGKIKKFAKFPSPYTPEEEEINIKCKNYDDVYFHELKEGESKEDALRGRINSQFKQLILSKNVSGKQIEEFFTNFFEPSEDAGGAKTLEYVIREQTNAFGRHGNFLSFFKENKFDFYYLFCKTEDGFDDFCKIFHGLRDGCSANIGTAIKALFYSKIIEDPYQAAFFDFYYQTIFVGIISRDFLDHESFSPFPELPEDAYLSKKNNIIAPLTIHLNNSLISPFINRLYREMSGESSDGVEFDDALSWLQKESKCEEDDPEFYNKLANFLALRILDKCGFREKFGNFVEYKDIVGNGFFEMLNRGKNVEKRGGDVKESGFVVVPQRVEEDGKSLIPARRVDIEEVKNGAGGKLLAPARIEAVADVGSRVKARHQEEDGARAGQSLAPKRAELLSRDHLKRTTTK